MHKNNAPLSGLFGNLSSRITQAKEEFRLVERERLMLDENKYVPVTLVNHALVNPSIPYEQKSLFQKRLHNNLDRANKIIKKGMYHGIVRLVPVEILPHRTYEEIRAVHRIEGLPDPKVIAAMNAKKKHVNPDDLEIQMLVQCALLGDILDYHAKALRDGDFYMTSRLSVAFKSGASDLQVWRDLNALEDCSSIFGGKPPRRREPRKSAKQYGLKPVGALNLA